MDRARSKSALPGLHISWMSASTSYVGSGLLAIAVVLGGCRMRERVAVGDAASDASTTAVTFAIIERRSADLDASDTRIREASTGPESAPDEPVVPEPAAVPDGVPPEADGTTARPSWVPDSERLSIIEAPDLDRNLGISAAEREDAGSFMGRRRPVADGGDAAPPSSP